MSLRIRSALLLVSLVTLTALAGCTDTPDTPTDRTDTKTLTVPARGAIEYKLYMREGDHIDYQWTAGRPLYYDFHGDAIDAPADEFTSHKTGTLASDGGGFTAPFTGRHGWYWSNNGASAVTVTLELDGVYTIIGLV